MGLQIYLFLEVLPKFIYCAQNVFEQLKPFLVKLLPVVLAPHLDVSSLTRLSALQPFLVPLTYKALVGSLFMVTHI